jgi:adenylate kinase family enzyme
MQKPVIIYVSGAPGSGKTTLAIALAEQLHIPRISSDIIHGGVAFTHPDHDRKQTLTNVFVPTLIDMTKKGISFVADQVLQKGVSEETIIDKLRPHATIVYIHTKASDPIQRYINRTRASKVASVVSRRENLLKRAAYHKVNLDNTNEPLEIGVPVLTVNTDDGYNPPLDEIIAFIKSRG